MDDTTLYPRHAEANLVEALADSPAVLIHGPRQSGKSTLAKKVGATRGYAYISFDEDVARAAAAADPAGFLADVPGRLILDEVQYVPALFAAMKAAIDRNRSPGRFILTGSANVLLLPKLADSLAGRMEIVRLHPLAQSELGRKRSGFIDALFTGEFKTRRVDRLGAELAEKSIHSGIPSPVGGGDPDGGG